MVAPVGVEPTRVCPTRFCPAFVAVGCYGGVGSRSAPRTNGAAGRSRTDTLLRARDFESRMSTSSITAAPFRRGKYTSSATPAHDILLTQTLAPVYEV